MQFGRPAYIVQGSGIEEGVNPEKIAESVDAAQGKDAQQPNQSESNNAFNPIHFYFPWPKQEVKLDKEGKQVKDKDDKVQTHWIMGRYGEKEKEYTWFNACDNLFGLPFKALVSSTNQRFNDDRKLEDITTPKSLRLTMISIFVIFVVSILQFSWSAGYHNNWKNTSDNIREKMIPMLLPPNADEIKWEGDANYSTVATKYSAMLMGFSHDVKTKELAITGDTDAAHAERRALHMEAATNLAKYLDTTCFPLYDLVLHQNLAIWIFSLIF